MIGIRLLPLQVQADYTAAGMTRSRAVLDAGGMVIRHGRLYGPSTCYQTAEPDPPRIQVDEAARRTIQILDAPPRIVELVE